jgi:SAM-dependent methyltransferase
VNELKNIGIHCYLGCKLLYRKRTREARAMFLGAAYRAMESVTARVSSKTVTCRLCGWRGRRFRTFVAGPYIRHDAVCPQCSSLERHRAFICVFERIRALFPDGVRLLDIAPNAAFSAYCRNDPAIDYLSIDLESPIAMRLMDIQSLSLADRYFDIVVCYHVLDYVPDDKKALSEIHRVLREDGIGILQESLSQEATVEWGYPKMEELFRIRRYGVDFVQRLVETNFRVATIRDQDNQPTFLIAKADKTLSSLSGLGLSAVLATHY